MLVVVAGTAKIPLLGTPTIQRIQLASCKHNAVMARDNPKRPCRISRLAALWNVSATRSSVWWTASLEIFLLECGRHAVDLGRSAAKLCRLLSTRNDRLPRLPCNLTRLDQARPPPARRPPAASNCP
jgi:hypothetical protein